MPQKVPDDVEEDVFTLLVHDNQHVAASCAFRVSNEALVKACAPLAHLLTVYHMHARGAYCLPVPLPPSH